MLDVTDITNAATISGPKLVIVGKQGAGKGTQCEYLARHYVIPHISTGDIFRSAMKSETEFGKKLKAIVDAGNLVPDEVTCGVVAERLDQDNTRERGFILDGFPRNIAQAEMLETYLSPLGIDLVIDLEIPTEVAVARMSSRRVCAECGSIYGTSNPTKTPGICDSCGGKVVLRDDDTEEAIRRRLALYESTTAPILAWYETHSVVARIDGTGSIDEVAERVVRAVDARMAIVRTR